MGYFDTLKKIQRSDFTGASAAERTEAARDVISLCSFACAGLVLQPLPGLEHAALPVQIGMVLGLAHVYGKELSRKRAQEVLLDLAAVTGVSIIARQALTTVAKVLLPGVGGVLVAPYAFSVTWATGHAAIHYFRTGGKPDKDKIKEIFEREREKSKAHYSDEKARESRPTKNDLEDA